MSLPTSNPGAGSYQRPTQEWVCGWTEAGHACPLGPNPRGNCLGTSACTPAKQGDRWNCARSVLGGGPCADGPSPDGVCAVHWLACQPRRSSAAKRRLIVWGTLILSFGFIAAIMGGPGRVALVSPGELTFKHGTVARTCETCHAVPLEFAREWLNAMEVPDKGAVLNRQCLNCHELGPQPAAPHGQTPEALAALESAAQLNPVTMTPPLFMTAARHLLTRDHLPDGSLICGTCHREHQGQRFNLATMDNDRCQACHDRQFRSFHRGHPEFTQYPYIKRTAVYFDHASHLGRHFHEPEGGELDARAPNTCNQCHEPAQREGMMLVRNFDKSCSQCHLSQVTETLLGGVKFLNLPGLDVATLQAQERISASTNGILYASLLPQPVSAIATTVAGLLTDPRIVAPPFSIGAWPDTATGPPTPFLRLLLATDPETARVLARLDGLNLADLRRANPGQLEDVSRLVWAIKGLFYDLSQDDELALLKRYRKLVSRELSPDELTALTGDLPVQFVLAATRRWLPSLATEVKAHRARQPLPQEKPPVDPEALRASPVTRSRWYRRDDDCTLEYLPRRHTDAFLQSWLDLSAAGDRPDGNALFPSVFATIANPYAAGRCTKCHSVSAGADNSYKVNWESAQPHADERPFTKFAHEPHFSLLHGKACDQCHVLKPDAAYAQSFVQPDNRLQTNAAHFASNFAYMTLNQCTDCHTGNQAGNSCLLCHNYHVGKFALWHTGPAFGSPDHLVIRRPTPPLSRTR